MQKVRKRIAALIVIIIFCTPQVYGQTKTKDLLAGIDYPELQVTPLASERLASEADKERDRKLSLHIPLLTSSALLLGAGLSVGKDDNLSPDDEDDFDSGKQIATIAGGAWLITAGIIAYTYTPYQNGHDSVKNLPAGTKKQKLTKERMAEEALYEPARKAWMLQWIPFVTNAGAAFILSDSNLDDDSRVFADVAILGALLPVIFSYRWQRVRAQHRDYKKRIFGPVASSATLLSSNGKDFVPGMNLTWTF